MLPGFSGHLLSESFLEQHPSLTAAALSPEPGVRLLRACRAQCLVLGPASAVRSVLECGAVPFARALGFSSPAQVTERHGHLLGILDGPSAPIALLVAPWGQRLDPLWRDAVVFARSHQLTWCLLFNGTHVRLLDAARLHSRRFVQFDIDLALDDERTTAVLWRVAGAGALGTGGRKEWALRQLVSESDAYGTQVCRSLRDGVLEASTDVLSAIVTRRDEVGPAFEQALTVVYRILFLLFAEARGLVPIWHPVYRDSYSVEALRRAAEQREHTPGLWDALRAVGRLAHAGCRAGDLRVTPFNGRLFAPSRTPLADRRNLDDRAARRAVLALSTRVRSGGAGREAIAYRDLGVEQLGAVYETLLDYTPRLVESPAAASEPPVAKQRGQPHTRPSRPSRPSRPKVTLEPGSGLRKATGTFYTPQPIAEYLVRRTLGPLVRDASPERILALRVLDPAMGSGAFLVAAATYLAQAYEAALVRTGRHHTADFGPDDRALLRRTIAERCLFGVDLNPMAVQLARLSLWLATLAGDRPLSFLDHHLLTGDSLLGAWVASLSRAPGHRRRATASLPLFETAGMQSALQDALPVRFTLGSEPNDTIDQVRAKERALAALNRRDAALSKWKRVADLWCASWFLPPEDAPASAFCVLTDAILKGSCALPKPATDRHLAAAAAAADRKRFFHWELEFPEVFFDSSGARLADGGFDAVLGNPPWDMVRADAGSADDRTQARLDTDAVVRFTRDTGLYEAQSDGHANRYQLFLERAITLTRPGGRIGLVLPSGLTMDHGSARLRGFMFRRCGVDAVVGFDNRDGVFPIHRSVRFVLLTATAGETTKEFRCRLGERSPAILESESDEPGSDTSGFPLRITPALLNRLSGPDLSLPDLRSPLDLTIAEKAAAQFPPLGDTNGWNVRFGRELNATDDRDCFKGAGHGLPVVEGKQLEPFRVHLESARWAVGAREAAARLGVRHERARLAYRDVASATNRTTLIAAILPRGCVSTHTVFCLRTPLPPAAQHFLCGLFNSFVVNYLARLRVSTHVTTAIVERLPVPLLDEAPAACREIVAIARLLARGRSRESRGGDAASGSAARLNALVAQLYRLTRTEFQHVLDTFPLVPRELRDNAMGEFELLHLVAST